MANVEDLKVGSQAYESALADLTSKQYATTVEGHLQRLEDAKTVIVAKTHEFVSLDLESGGVTLDDAAIALSNIVNHGTVTRTVTSNSFPIDAGYYAGGTITISGDGAFKLVDTNNNVSIVVGEDGSSRQLTVNTTEVLKANWIDVKAQSLVIENVYSTQEQAIAYVKSVLKDSANSSHAAYTEELNSYIEQQAAYGVGSAIVTIDPKFQNVTEVDAVASDVLASKKFVAKDGTVVTGTIPTQNPNATTNVLSIGNTTKQFKAGYYPSDFTVGISTESKVGVPGTTETTVTPTDGKVLSEVKVAGIKLAHNEVQDNTDRYTYSVNVSAVSSNESTNGTPITSHTIDMNKSVISVGDLTLDANTGKVSVNYSANEGYTKGAEGSKEISIPLGSEDDLGLSWSTTENAIVITGDVPSKGKYYIQDLEGTLEISTQVKSVEGINNEPQEITPDSGKVLSKVVVPGVDTVEFSQPELYTLANPQVFHVTATVKDTNGNEVINKVNSLTKSNLTVAKNSEVSTDGVITTTVTSNAGYTKGETKSSTYNLKEKITLTLTDIESTGRGQPFAVYAGATVKASDDTNVTIATDSIEIPVLPVTNNNIQLNSNTGEVTHTVVLGEGYETGQTVTQTLALGVLDIESVGNTGSAGYVTATESASLFTRLAAI